MINISTLLQVCNYCYRFVNTFHLSEEEEELQRRYSTGLDTGGGTSKKETKWINPNDLHSLSHGGSQSAKIAMDQQINRRKSSIEFSTMKAATALACQAGHISADDVRQEEDNSNSSLFGMFEVVESEPQPMKSSASAPVVAPSPKPPTTESSPPSAAAPNPTQNSEAPAAAPAEPVADTTGEAASENIIKVNTEETPILAT